jgi:hypothetical protein
MAMVTLRPLRAVAGTMAIAATVLAAGIVAGPAANAGIGQSPIPGGTTTGVPLFTRLTQHYGTITINQPGTVLSNLDIHGDVVVAAANVVIKDSIIRGGALATHDHCILTASSPNVRNLLLEDSELVPEHPNVYTSNLCGGNFTALRVNSHGGVDAVDIFGDNASVLNSWLHGTAYYPVDPNHSGGPTHNDSIQILSGSNITISGNRLSGGNNSAIQITQDHGKVSNVRIADNSVNGGSCSIRADDKPLTSMAAISVSGNVFIADQTIRRCVILVNSGVGYTSFDNAWFNGGSVPVTRAN